MSLFDNFTQAQLGINQVQSTDIGNQQAAFNLAMQKAKFEAGLNVAKNLASPMPAGLSQTPVIGGSAPTGPDATSELAAINQTPQTVPPQIGSQAMPSAVDRLNSTANYYGNAIAKMDAMMRSATSPADAAAALDTKNALIKEQSSILEKIPVAAKDEAETKLKLAKDNADKWGSINSQQDLNYLVSTAPPEFKQHLAQIGIFPGFDGQYNYADPKMQQFIQMSNAHALDAKDQAEIADKAIGRQLEAAKNASLAKFQEAETGRATAQEAEARSGVVRNYALANKEKSIFNQQTQQWESVPDMSSKTPSSKVIPTVDAAGNVQAGTLSADAQKVAENIATGHLAPITGSASRTPRNTAIMAEVMRINPEYQQTDYGTKQAAEKAFTSGTLGGKVRSLNVVDNHLTTLGQLTDALNNNDIPAVNKIGNFFTQQTGKPAPTNFDAAKQIVADEVIAAVVAQGGAMQDRQEAAASINRASSPAQLKGVIDTYKSLIQGQQQGLKQQYETGTGKQDFNARFLSQSAQNRRASDKTPSFEEGKVYQDAKGNKAKYVGGQWVPQ